MMHIGKILITGASGMVGKSLVQKFQDEGIPFVAPTSMQLDLLNKDAVAAYLHQEKPQCIIHLAAKVGGIHANMSDPYGFMSKNLVMGINLVECAKEFKVLNFINFGASCMYPRNAPIPFNESDLLTGPFEDTNVGYALAKVTTLKLCEFIDTSSDDLNYKTLIPCNLYGEHDNFSLTSSHLIPAIIQKIYAAKKASADHVEVWGDGTARREFMYVKDLANVIFQCLLKLDQLPTIMNVGTGVTHSVRDYYEIIAKEIGWNGNFKYSADKPTGMQVKVCNIERMSRLGLTANTPIKVGVKNTVNFYGDNYG